MWDSINVGGCQLQALPDESTIGTRDPPSPNLRVSVPFWQPGAQECVAIIPSPQYVSPDGTLNSQESVGPQGAHRPAVIRDGTECGRVQRDRGRRQDSSAWGQRSHYMGREGPDSTFGCGYIIGIWSISNPVQVLVGRQPVKDCKPAFLLPPLLRQGRGHGSTGSNAMPPNTIPIPVQHSLLPLPPLSLTTLSSPAEHSASLRS
mmetsp:Transcript_2714/g.5826  ORF Transcript_2714/g.5826 Transcript_2714/m.5826 type:complete len:204 (+) Transcript_2714:776-1387(+)